MSKKRYGNELHPLYPRWLSITQRCNNPSNSNYPRYGAKGIRLSEDLQSFEQFKEYIENLPGYSPEEGQIDRIDNSKGYEKGNLRWACRSTQIANQSSSGKGKNRFTGVNWSVTHQRWVARVSFKGKNLFSKVFLTEFEALEARNQFIRENNLPHTIQVYK